MPHHFEWVGSQITGCSNLYPLNASQSVSKIRLLVFTVSCFTVTDKPSLGTGGGKGWGGEAEMMVEVSLHLILDDTRDDTNSIYTQH